MWLPPQLRNFAAEAEWTLFRNRSNSHTQYDLWAKQRRNLFHRWGNLPTTSRENAALRQLKDKYRGQRIFLLGSGPSLNRLDLDKLRDEYTFGVNRIYLLYDRISWRPTFYTVNDWEVAPDNAGEIQERVDSISFIPVRFRGLFDSMQSAYYYNSRHAERPGEFFSYDLEDGAIMGGTVMTCAIQIAYYLGFDPIYLIGVDVDYKIQDTVEQSGSKRFSDGNLQFLRSTQDDDINHFDPRYFGAGKRWHNPNTENMVVGFHRCREAMEARGRQLLNATAGGKLDVIPRVDFESLFTTTAGAAIERHPTVSIIMPAYNASEHIAAAIDSVLTQTFEDWELIIVDDGSTDTTSSIIQSYTNHRIRYIRQENKGRASARNAALEVARGEFIAFLDADDLFEPNKLEIQVKLLRDRPKLGGVRGAWKRISKTGELLRVRAEQKRRVLRARSAIAGNPLLLSMSMIRRDFIDRGLRFEEGRRYAEDWVFAQELLMSMNCRVLSHPECVGLYRMTDQAIAKTTDDYARAHIDVVERVFGQAMDSELEALLANARFRVRIRMAARCLAAANLDLAHRLLTEAAKYRIGDDSERQSYISSEIIAWGQQLDIDPISIALNLDSEQLREMGLTGLPGRILSDWYQQCVNDRHIGFRDLLRARFALSRHRNIMAAAIEIDPSLKGIGGARAFIRNRKHAAKQAYARFAGATRRQLPGLFRLGQVGSRVIRLSWTRPLGILVGLLIAFSPAIAALLVEPSQQFHVLAIGQSALLFVFAIVALAHESIRMRNILAIIDGNRRRVDSVEARSNRLEEDLTSGSSRLRSLEAELGSVSGRLQEASNNISLLVGTRAEHVQHIDALLKLTEAQSNERREASKAIAKISSELKRLAKESRKLDATRSDLAFVSNRVSELNKSSTRLADAEAEISAMRAGIVAWRRADIDYKGSARKGAVRPVSIDEVFPDIGNWDTRPLYRKQEEISFAPVWSSRKKPILLNSIPKAGTYLFARLLACLGATNVDVHLFSDSYQDFRGIDLEDLVSHPVQFRVPVPFERSSVLVKGGQFAVGHVSYSAVTVEASKRFVHFFCVRDLRDLLISHMRFLMDPRRVGSAKGRWSSEHDGPELFLRYMQGPGGKLAKARILPALDWLKDPSVQLLRFEDIMGDRGEGVQSKLVETVCIGAGLKMPSDPLSLLQDKVLGVNTRTFSGHRSNHRDFWGDQVEALYQDLGLYLINRELGYQ
ncbi:hypothetical protein GL4_2807 [Methyloceanibacter caenitepidi]|uniref:Uncharacterized protein n=1 Tax=Methyloceanibacter caenitepidi TaxID=1384459 RepID=A0A0A8K608_9HYPH|nr:hypothetical protein GL4_2807 [Methyloceanibacter caenitepidi]